ncbi:MAG TPA: AI-2E family transporter [Candidatus Nanoarchaeia archaeon]|nr:AI-2E family transporter [Candidatus Nanoarchaeia archaeon]
MERKDVQKVVLIGLFLVLLYVSYLVVKPFVSALLAAFVLAYVFHPVYKWLGRKIKSEFAAAFIVTAIVVLLILLPLIAVANALIREAAQVYRSGGLTTLTTHMTELVGKNTELNSLVSSSFSKALVYITNAASNFVVSVPSKIFHFVIAIYALFHLLRGGEVIVNKVRQNIPFKNKEILVKGLGDTTYAIVYGIFVIALVEFIITAIGFRVLGIGSPLLWAVVVAVFALIPFLGPAVVWLPFAVVKVVQGNYGIAVGLVIVGMLLTLIDTFGRPWVIGQRTKMHPVMVIIGIVGGMGIFGFIGIIVGPLLLSFVSNVVESYYGVVEKHEAKG